MRVPAQIGRVGYSNINQLRWPSDYLEAGGYLWTFTELLGFTTTLRSGQKLSARFWPRHPGFDLGGGEVSVKLDATSSVFSGLTVVSGASDTRALPAGNIRTAVEDLIRTANPKAQAILAADRVAQAKARAEQKAQDAAREREETTRKKTERAEALRRANKG
jgi:hypothetical protein